jgi:hypothetical protein
VLVLSIVLKVLDSTARSRAGINYGALLVMSLVVGFGALSSRS